MSKSKITGWVLTALLALMLIGVSAKAKLTAGEGEAKEFARIGFTTDQMFKIGIVEIVITVLFLIPRTSFLGAILLTGYLGGATVTHLRIGEPFIPPVVFGVIVWVALGLRQSKIFALAFGGCGSCCPAPPKQDGAG